jgi:site-specific recombinase XerC
MTSGLIAEPQSLADWKQIRDQLQQETPAWVQGPGGKPIALRGLQRGFERWRQRHRTI